MKKSRIAKLALMGASITALAATLTTSTYAWYISNQTASVDAVTGATASAGTDGSILVSNSGAYNTFFRTTSLVGPSAETTQLQPVYSPDGKTFYALGSDTTDPTKAVTPTLISEACTNGTYAYHYQFWVLSIAGGTYDPTITIKNTGSYNTQTCYESGIITYASGTVTEGQSFSVNALNALTLTMTSTPHDGSAYGSAGYNGTANEAGFTAGTTSAVTGNALSVDNSAAVNTVSTYVKTQNTNTISGIIATGGAQDYYNALSNENLASPFTTAFAPANGIGQLTLAANTPVRLDYYLFLDGADDVCFNACAGQSISIEFSYTKH